METVKTCECEFTDKEAEKQFKADFLRAYSDLPEEEILKAVSDDLIPNWVLRCDCQDQSKIISSAHYKPSDWYLCSIKGVAVEKEKRGMGLGGQIVADAVDLASKNPNCIVLASDITSDNIPSIKAFQSAGFQQVGRFCWEKGEKPADIMHLIRFEATDTVCRMP